MSNIYLTPLTFSRGVLMNLKPYMNTARNLSTEYKKEFGNKAQKIGSVFNVRKPQRFVGSTNIQYTPEGIKNLSTPITVDKTYQIAFDYNNMEKTLSLEDANNRLFKPAAAACAAKLNRDAAEFAFFNTYNHVGTPGVIPGSGSQTIPELLRTYMGARDLLIEQGMPQNEELNMIISSRMSSEFVGRVTSLFVPQEGLTKQFKTGYIDPTNLGMFWHKDQALYKHTTGVFAGTPLVDGANQTGTDGNNGTQTLLLKGLTGATTGKKGDWFTIAGVYSVEPMSRVSTGQLQQFKIQADWTASGGGAATITIAPAITPTGQYQNVDAAPADSAEVLFCQGTHSSPAAYASSTMTSALLLTSMSHALVSVPMEGPESGMGAIYRNETDPETGVNISVLSMWDPILNRQVNRLDMLYGFGRLYSEMACVVCSQ